MAIQFVRTNIEGKVWWSVRVSGQFLCTDTGAVRNFATWAEANKAANNA